ncbi:hypothetical protein, partial [Phaeodactylibacter luteus]
MKTMFKQTLAVFVLLMSAFWARGQDAYVNPTGTCAGGTPCFSTIQAAVDAASVGNVIQVEAGTYVESVIIDKSLDLRGAQFGNGLSGRSFGGAMESTIVAPSGQNAITTPPSGANDLSIRGFSFTSAGGDGGGVNMAGLADNLFVAENLFSGFTDRLAFSPSAGSSGVTFMRNSVANAYAGAYFPNGASGLVSMNIITGLAGGAGAGDRGSAVVLEGSSPNVSVVNNTLTGNETGVFVFSSALAGGADNLTGTTVFNNDLSGNATFIANNRSVPLSATCNWYGSADAAAINAGLAGDVVFTPFLANGTDDDPATPGFQAVAGSCTGVGPVANLTQGLNYLTIQAAVDAAASGEVIEVSAGTYNENVSIDKALTLQGVGNPTIQGADNPATLGTIFIRPNVNNVTVSGFTIIGYDTANPGLEEAAVYLQGDHDNIQILNNTLTANGEAAFLEEFGGSNTNLAITGNTIDGQTFVGTPGGCGFGSQFTTPNVPRQLVVIQGGTDSNITFSDNSVTGITGAATPGNVPPCDAVGQGNTAVTIDADNVLISGNTFAATLARFGTQLRTRGTATSISGNTIDNTNSIGEASTFQFIGPNTLTGAVPDNAADMLDGNTYTPGDVGFIVSGGSITVFTCPVLAAPAAAAVSKSFCEGAAAADRRISVSDALTADQAVVWVLQSAPLDAGYTTGEEFSPCSGNFNDGQVFLSGTTRRTIRLESGAPAGTYVFKAKIVNCLTGCESPLSAADFTLEKFEAPELVFTADPNGDICLGDEVMYDATLSEKGGGPYAFSWGAYNNGTGAGTRFTGGFSPDNAAEDVTRSWTSSTGAKSVDVMASSATPGCEVTSPLYSFAVNPNPSAPAIGVQDKTFCHGDPTVSPNLAGTGVSVSGPLGTGEKVVWVLTAVPSNSDLSVGDEFTTDNCGDPFKNFGELAVASTSRVIRVNSSAPQNGLGEDIFGAYRFTAVVENCATGCRSTEVGAFSITINERPELMLPNFSPTVCSDAVLGSNFTAFMSANSVPFSTVDVLGATPDPSLTPAAGSPTTGTSLQPDAVAGDAYTNLTAGGRNVAYSIVLNGDNGCTSDPTDFTFRILGEPILSPALDETVCSNDPAGIMLSLASAGFQTATGYNIISITPEAGLLPGAGNAVVGAGQAADAIAADTWENQGTTPLTVTYRIAPERAGPAASVCEGDAVDVVLTVLPVPDITINSFAGNPFGAVCVGDEARFLASPPATPAPGVQTYAWSFSGSPVVNDYGQTAADNTTRRNQGAVYTAADAVLQTVDLTVTYLNGCTTDAPTHNIMVNPLPDVQIVQAGGNPFDVVCSGEQGVYLANINNPAPGGNVNRYAWSVMPAAGVTISGAGQSADVSGRRRVLIDFPANTGSSPMLYTVMLELEDANGCVNTASQTVEVLPLPMITCPAPIVVATSNNGSGDCEALASWIAPADVAGACMPRTLSYTIDGGTPITTAEGAMNMATLEAGVHLVEYSLSDGNSNIAACDFTITVEDDEKPSSIALPDLTFTTSTDMAICPGNAMTSLVVDQSTPVATAADNFTFTVHGVTVNGPSGITDNCSDPADINIFVWNIQEVSTDPSERIFKVFFRYFDQAGNWRQRGQEFTIVDDTRPSSIALPDLTFTTSTDMASCPGNAMTSLVVDQSTPVATAADNFTFTVHGVTVNGPSGITDNCSDPADINIFVWNIQEISTDPSESIFKVFFRYFDQAGNWRQRGQEFTIVDDTPPVIVCQDITIELDANGEYMIANDEALISLSDNCTIPNGPFTAGGPPQRM